jgi:scyllo-inositol 2-dehydrogenase (NADP+)
MDNTIKTALISYGMSGEVFHAPFIEAHDGFALSTVLQRKTKTANQRYPNVTVVSDWNAILQDTSIELVVVNTPNDTHAVYAAEALRAGKHVIVEKPFTVTVGEADKLIALAKEKNRILTVFQNRRWDGDYLTLKKIYQSGRLGKVVELEMHYDRYRNYIDLHTWKEQEGSGVGILYNLGSHMIDQAIDLMGMPTAVFATVGIQRAGGKVDDFYDIRLYYPACHIILKSSYLVKALGPRYMMHGTQGSFIKYGIDPQEEALKRGESPCNKHWGEEDRKFWGRCTVVEEGVEKEETIPTIPGNYSIFYQHVYDAIRNGAPLAVTPEQSRNVIALIEACYLSNKERKVIDL